MNLWEGSPLRGHKWSAGSRTAACTNQDFMNEMSGAKRIVYTGAFKLKVIAFAENSGKRDGRE